MISAHGTIETAVNATKMGAFDFIQKPPDLNRLLLAVRNALDKSNLVNETKTLKKKISKNYDMVGESPEMIQIKEDIEKVAPTEARVLITGPNDSGKEFITKLRFIEPDITIEEIWNDLNNFHSCTMVDNHELKILTEARAILKHEVKTMQMIANL